MRLIDFVVAITAVLLRGDQDARIFCNSLVAFIALVSVEILCCEF